MYQSVVNNKINIHKSHKYFLFIGYIVPMLFAIPPYALGYFGPSIVGCWIELKLDQKN